MEQVRERLQAAKGQWRWLSDDSGVAYDTLTKIAQGVFADPGYSKVVAIAASLDKLAARISTTSRTEDLER